MFARSDSGQQDGIVPLVPFAASFDSGYGWGMTVEATKEAIAELSEDQRHSLAVWLNEIDYDDWDKEMVKDFSPGGRGMAWVEKVKREIAEGKAGPFEEGLAEPRLVKLELREQ
jgi:hypothetical protein